MDAAIKVVIDEGKCNGCGKCVADCLYSVIEVQDGKARVLSDDCLKCGHCLAVCPMGAVWLEGLDDEILEASDAAGTFDAGVLRDHLKLRRSVRHFRADPVEKETLEKVIEAGRLTPSGSNKQNVRYIVVQHGINDLEDEIIAQYKQELGQPARRPGDVPLSLDLSKYTLERGFLFHGAPALILVVSENNTNACLAAMSMELMAEALGLGTLYVGLFVTPANRNEALRASLGIAAEENIAVCLALGHPAVTYLRSAPKKPANIIWRQ